jgi:DNA polymerase-3 subunit gamma/tau
MSSGPQDKQKPGYLVLARKYRPRQFSEVVGQEAVVRTLQNAIRENRLGHAYLFSGMRGVGKTTVARILAKALNCEQGPTSEPCNRCFMCKAINEENLMDFIEIDGASNRGIEDVKALRESVQYEPMHSRYRVIIIDEVHQLSRDAFNALLKTLEEPPSRTIFIFATTEFHKVPKTITSRCQHFVFKRLTHQQIVQHLSFISGQENIEISPYSLKLIAEAAEGSLRDAETLLDMVVSFSGQQVQDKDTEEVLGVINRNLFENLARIILEGRSGEVFTVVDSLISSGYDLRHFYSGLIEYFRNLLLVKVSTKASELLLLSAEEIGNLKEISQNHSSKELLRYLLLLQDGEIGLRYSSQPRIFLEAWLIKLCYLNSLKPLEETLTELKKMEESLTESSAKGTGYNKSELSSSRSVKQSSIATDYGASRKISNNHSNNLNGLSVFNQEVADELYFRLVREKPALAPIFKMVNRLEVETGVIRLIYSAERKHFADLIQQNLPYLKRLALELGGREVELRIEEPVTNHIGKGAISNPGSGQEKSAIEKRSELLQDPKARALINTLRGQVIAVRKKSE